MEFDLVVIGHLLKEYIQFPDRKIGPVLGSPCAYTPVAAARLGVKTGIVTKIGEDMPKDLLDQKNIAEKFIEWGAKVGIITLGKEGAIAVARDSPSYQILSYSAIVTDCTGAGDVFHAGFLTEYLRSSDLGRSIRFALATASLVIENTGGVIASRMPKEDKVLERMKMEEVSV